MCKLSSQNVAIRIFEQSLHQLNSKIAHVTVVVWVVKLYKHVVNGSVLPLLLEILWSFADSHFVAGATIVFNPWRYIGGFIGHDYTRVQYDRFSTKWIKSRELCDHLTRKANLLTAENYVVIALVFIWWVIKWKRQRRGPDKWTSIKVLRHVGCWVASLYVRHTISKDFSDVISKCVWVYWILLESNLLRQILFRYDWCLNAEVVDVEAISYVELVTVFRNLT